MFVGLVEMRTIPFSVVNPDMWTFEVACVHLLVFTALGLHSTSKQTHGLENHSTVNPEPEA